jgi:hypothetical protein
VVEYITADGLFSIDLALRPQQAQEQSTQPAAATADARIHANGSEQSSDIGSGSSNGSASVTAELEAGDGADGAQEHQVRACEATKMDVCCVRFAHFLVTAKCRTCSTCTSCSTVCWQAIPHIQRSETRALVPTFRT